MIEFTVTITRRPLGVKFALFDKVVGVEKIDCYSPDSLLGLLCGDILVSINNKSVLNMEAKQILEVFSSQPLPFLATFERFDDNSNALSDDDTSESFCKLVDEDSDALSDDFTNSHQKHRLSINTNNDAALPELSKMYDLLKYQSDTATPVDTTIPKCNNTHFVHIDHHDADIFDIDACTVNLVNGFVRTYAATTKSDQTDTTAAVDLISKYLCNNTVMFDKQKDIKSANISQVTTVCTSSFGFTYGQHEWSIKVIKCDHSLQEIGVISNNNLCEIMVEEGGITETNSAGARAVYGNEKMLGTNYYMSCNENGHRRVYKELVNQYWKNGDIIKIHLNLKNNRVTYYLNGKKVRKVISLEANKIYYPFIAFSNGCRYELIDYQ